MAKRLYIDLNRCDACERCTVECAYFYKPSVEDHGLLALRERVTFALVCRRCEEPSCVAACKFGALERQENGVLKRYNLRCVSCKCCAQACPFGTIYPDTVPFYVTHCDLCLASDRDPPPCVISCPRAALEFREVGEGEPDVCLIEDGLAVRGPKWKKEDV